MDEQIDAPTGFNIIFPGLVQLGIEMGLEFSVRESSVRGILRLKEMEMERFVNDNSNINIVFMNYVNLLGNHSKVYFMWGFSPTIVSSKIL